MPDRYDIQRTWRWNLDHSPLPQTATSESLPGNWSWCGVRTNSPLGISAGPLLNSGWLLHYADRGFDILVYKTVRSSARDCYELPNLVPVVTGPLDTPGKTVPEADHMLGSWAVSFGMPSQTPDEWRRDVEVARRHLAPGQVLVVSVVGTQKEDDAADEESLESLADDFALCAKWAMESGAHGVEANFSCPNVSTTDGQLYQHPKAAALVAERIRAVLDDAPLVLKIGRVADETAAAEFLAHVGPFIDGLAMTNSISARVQNSHGELLFDGQSRGICGDATRATSVSQTQLFRDVMATSPHSVDLIGVGGISTATHVHEYLVAGATSVALATSVMVDPNVGREIRKNFIQ